MIFKRLPAASARAGAPVYAAIEPGPASPRVEPPADVRQGHVIVFRDPGAAFGLPPDGPAEQEAWADRLLAAAAVPAMAPEDVPELLGADRVVVLEELLQEWHVKLDRLPADRDREQLRLLAEKYRVPAHVILRTWRLSDLNLTTAIAATPGQPSSPELLEAIGMEV